MDGPGGLRPPPMLPPHLRSDEAMDRFVTATIADGPLGGGGTLYVDPERAQECIDGLKRAARLVNLALTQVDDMSFPPPAMDPVSINLAEQGHLMRQRAELFARRWLQQLTDTIDQLEAQLAAYHGQEDEIRATFT